MTGLERQKQFDKWVETSVRGDLLQSGYVVFEAPVNQRANPIAALLGEEEKWLYGGTANIVGKLVRTYTPKEANVPLTDMPCQFEFDILCGAWTTSPHVQKVMSLYMGDISKDSSISVGKAVPIPKRIMVTWQRWHTGALWFTMAKNGGLPFTFRSADNLTTLTINWNLTREYNMDRQTAIELVKKNGYDMALPQVLVKLIADYVDCVVNERVLPPQMAEFAAKCSYNMKFLESFEYKE